MNRIYCEKGKEIITPSALEIKGGIALKLLSNRDLDEMAPQADRDRITFSDLSIRKKKALTGKPLFKTLKRTAGSVVSDFLSNYDCSSPTLKLHFTILLKKVRLESRTRCGEGFSRSTGILPWPLWGWVQSL